VQKVRWDCSSTEPTGKHTFFFGKGNENHELGTGSFVQKRIISAVTRIGFVSDRMSYIILIVLHVHDPTEDKIYDMKDSFYEELACIFEKFPKYHMKILLQDFNAKVGREDIFKMTTGNESLHEISNDN
jgi:hypothetical protein